MQNTEHHVRCINAILYLCIEASLSQHIEMGSKENQAMKL